MSWNGSMQLSRDSQSVTVMALLSVAPARKICFSPLAATVTLLVATNFEDFWSIFMMSMSGMLRWKTLSLISWRNCDLRSAQRDLVITGLDLLTTRREYFILWYNDQTHDLVTLKSIYFLNLFGFLQTNPFSTPETTWMLIPAPAVRRFSRIERNLRSSTSSISNGRFLTLLIVDCSLVSPFFFCSCMDFFLAFYPWTVQYFWLSWLKFGWIFLIAFVTPKVAACFVISCLSFSAQTVCFFFSFRVTFKLSWTFSSSFTVVLLGKSFFIDSRYKDPK